LGTDGDSEFGNDIFFNNSVMLYSFGDNLIDCCSTSSFPHISGNSSNLLNFNCLTFKPNVCDIDPSINESIYLDSAVDCIDNGSNGHNSNNLSKSYYLVIVLSVILFVLAILIIIVVVRYIRKNRTIQTLPNSSSSSFTPLLNE
jgi:hypothetical protein